MLPPEQKSRKQNAVPLDDSEQSTCAKEKQLNNLVQRNESSTNTQIGKYKQKIKSNTKTKINLCSAGVSHAASNATLMEQLLFKI